MQKQKKFVYEAQSAFSLDHPNICTIHESGETNANWTLFISMAYYEGETLKEKIEKGKIDFKEAIDIALQICEGLKRLIKIKLFIGI